MQSLQTERSLDSILPICKEVRLMQSFHCRKPSYCVQNEKIECKTCKKWFISEEKKKEHLALHETCPYPNCSFNAIEKVLSAHIASVHQKKETRIPPSLLELIPEK